MRNMMGMMKKAQEVQNRIQALQDDMANARFSASIASDSSRDSSDSTAAADAVTATTATTVTVTVTVTVNGKGQLQAVKIAPDALATNDSAMLESLILLASNRACDEANVAMQAQMADITGGLDLPPGMNLPF